ncbi:hypothetical protein [Halogeometricum pallidum]|uniref:hypothetical protein n=1 Tax=Halogeometricum pallidum TaxID=411361 RepID=UPI001EF9EC1F|nr:hypothetical protein [Halogeometricum pallidum]
MSPLARTTDRGVSPVLGGTLMVVVSHEAGSVADGSEVFVRDDAGNEIVWEAVRTGESSISPGGYSKRLQLSTQPTARCRAVERVMTCRRYCTFTSTAGAATRPCDQSARRVSATSSSSRAPTGRRSG